MDLKLYSKLHHQFAEKKIQFFFQQRFLNKNEDLICLLEKREDKNTMWLSNFQSDLISYI